MNYIVHGVAKSWTQLCDLHFTSLAGVWCSQITSFKEWHILLLSFWLCGKACEVLVSWSGIEPEPWQWKRQVLTTRPPGNSLKQKFKKIWKQDILIGSDWINRFFSIIKRLKQVAFWKRERYYHDYYYYYASCGTNMSSRPALTLESHKLIF